MDRFCPGRVQHFFLGAKGQGEEMRKPRKETLGNTGLFHKMWRGHNREPVLEKIEDKRSYCRHLKDTYTDEVRQKVDIFSINLMTNHCLCAAAHKQCYVQHSVMRSS